MENVLHLKYLNCEWCSGSWECKGTFCISCLKLRGNLVLAYALKNPNIRDLQKVKPCMFAFPVLTHPQHQWGLAVFQNFRLLEYYIYCCTHGLHTGLHSLCKTALNIKIWGIKKENYFRNSLILSDPGRARTVDPMIKSHLLYQLSYGVIFSECKNRFFIFYGKIFMGIFFYFICLPGCFCFFRLASASLQRITTWNEASVSIQGSYFFGGAVRCILVCAWVLLLFFGLAFPMKFSDYIVFSLQIYGTR